jgi:hypothetical protein
MPQRKSKPEVSSRPAAAAAEPAAPPTAQPKPQLPNLTPEQEYFALLAADMILHGGDESEVAAFVRVLQAHSWTRKYPREALPHWIGSRDAIEKLASGFTPAPVVTSPEAKSNSATELLRARLAEQLAEDVNDFLKEAEPIDIYLLKEVVDSYNQGCGQEVEKSVRLAECFLMELGEGGMYLRVRDLDFDMVAGFAKRLEQGNAA